MAEAGYQTKTIEYARRKGFLAHRNYFAPGCEVGWPDVEIFLPDGYVLLIEFKERGYEVKKIQGHRIAHLRKLGHRVVTCYSFEDARKVIDALR